MYSLLVEEERGTDWRIPAGMLAAVVAAVGQPGFSSFEADVLRDEVYRYASRLLDISD